MSEDKMLIENKLMQMVVEETNDEGNTYYRLNSAFDNETIAGSIVGAAKVIDKLRKFQPDDELRETNRKLGSDLLKAEAKLVSLSQEKEELMKRIAKAEEKIEREADKQTRLEIMNMKIAKLESERETYKYCFEFLSECKTES